MNCTRLEVLTKARLHHLYYEATVLVSNFGRAAMLNCDVSRTHDISTPTFHYKAVHT
jgi:hypothetical protein